MALAALRGIRDISQETKVCLRKGISKGIKNIFKIIFCYSPGINWSERQRKASSVLSV